MRNSSLRASRSCSQPSRITATVTVASLATLARTAAALTIVIVTLTLCVACSPQPKPPPAATLQEVKTDISRGGRSVAVTVSPADTQSAIVASESGGLFRTTDRGNTWRHIDSFPPFRMVDVAFPESGSSNAQVVIATTIKDAQTSATANNGGVWRSTDSGLTWSHLTLPTDCVPPQTAYGIAYSGSDAVFVGADCGLLASNDLGASWTVALNQGVRSMVARQSGTNTLLDVCLIGGGHKRSTDGGATWSTIHLGPDCATVYSIAASPLEPGVLFATQGSGLLESDDGGQTWPINLQATAYNERPVWVRTRPAIDQDPTHFDLYFPGRRATCSNSAPRCPSNMGETWARVPASPLNHDLNGLAFDPAGNCPLLMVADWGVYRSGNPSPNAPCGADSAWTHVGRASTGLGSLQIYDVAGQLHYPISGSGVSISGYTNLFIGTMDNLLWANHDAGDPVGAHSALKAPTCRPSMRPRSPQPQTSS